MATQNEKASKEESMNASDKECLRDAKGHFVSGGGKTANKTPQKKEAKKGKDRKEEDSNRVKIRIIKEEQPIPDKDYEGRLEDMKERTATNFIKAVCVRKPKSISIDGNIYYAQEELLSLAKQLKETESREDDALRTLEKMGKEFKTVATTIDFLDDTLKKVRRSRFMWKSIAIIAISAYVSFAIGQVVGRCGARQSVSEPSVTQVNQVK